MSTDEKARFPFTVDDFRAAYDKHAIVPASQCWYEVGDWETDPIPCACPLGILVLDRVGVEVVRAIEGIDLAEEVDKAVAFKAVGKHLGLTLDQVHSFVEAFDFGDPFDDRSRRRMTPEENAAYEAGLEVRNALLPGWEA